MQQDNANVVGRHIGDANHLKEEDEKVGQNCSGEVIAECLECGETFQIHEPVPHSPLQERRTYRK